MSRPSLHSFTNTNLLSTKKTIDKKSKSHKYSLLSNKENEEHTSPKSPPKSSKMKPFSPFGEMVRNMQQNSNKRFFGNPLSSIFFKKSPMKTTPGRLISKPSTNTSQLADPVAEISLYNEAERNVQPVYLGFQKSEIEERMQNSIYAKDEKIRELQSQLKEAQESLFLINSEKAVLQGKINEMALQYENRIEYLEGVNREILARLEETKQKELELLDEQANMKQRLFYNIALSIKLDGVLNDYPLNFEIPQLYDQVVQQNVPVNMWNKWIFENTK